MAENNTVSKTTMYIAIGIALLVGFLSGVVYSVYNAPTGSPTAAVEDKSTSKIASLEKEVKDHPDNGVAWANLGHAYFDSAQHEKAIYAYNKALEMHPADPNLLTDLGVMYRRNDQPHKAIETFDRAIEANPQHEPARFNKGVVLLSDLHDQKGAITVWQELIQLNPAATLPDGSSLTDMIRQIKAQQAK